MIPLSAKRPRIDLAAAIPLEAPLALFIEPTNICNFKCPICPEALPDFQERAGYYEHMSPELWKKVLESLRQWPKTKVIRFYLEGEPLLNSNLPTMIADVHELTERTVVTTNGSLLSKRAREIIAAGLSYLRVSIYGTNMIEQYVNTGSRVTLESIHDQMLTFMELRGSAPRPYVQAELVIPQPTAEKIEKFTAIFGHVADECTVVPELHNWKGPDSTLVHIGEGGRQLKRKVCPQPFYQLAIRANGAVTVCCADWDNRLAVGNVNRESLQDIWHGSRLSRLRNTHLSGLRSTIAACMDCTAFARYPDDLDSLIGSRFEPRLNSVPFDFRRNRP